MAEEHVQVESASPVAARPSDELRQTLDRLDNLVGILRRRSPEEIEEIPALLENAHVLLERLKSRSKEFQAEEARLRTVQGQFDKQDRAFVGKLGAARIAQLRAAQGDAAPPETHWWWYMDRLVAERNRTRLKRLGLGAAIVAVVAIIAILIYQNFLAPDPALVAAYGHRGRAEDLAFGGNFQAALDEIEQGLALVPDDAELLVLRGVVLDSLGESDAAQAAYEAARSVLVDRPDDFLFLRAQEYIRTNQPELAITDMQSALEVDPESGEAYYLMAAAQESLDRVQDAYQSYSMAAQYASQNGNVQLEALARMQLANLTNRLLIPTMPPQATATP